MTLSFKAPPMTGPMLENKPNRLTTIARNSGRSFKVHTYVRIPNAPWRSPAAPNPAMALPVMKAREEGAEAQTTDPTTLYWFQAPSTNVRKREERGSRNEALCVPSNIAIEVR